MFITFHLQTGKAVSPNNENASNRAAECIAERIEVFKSAFGETEEQLNQEKYVRLMLTFQFAVISNQKNCTYLATVLGLDLRSPPGLVLSYSTFTFTNAVNLNS